VEAVVNIELEIKGATDKEVADFLRTQLTKYEPRKPYNPWLAFVWGLSLMAMLNIGDVHICVGECDGSGFKLSDALK
jgi:hypothetical protein